MSRTTLFCLVIILISTAIVQADVKLPAIFGDHMVLQQKADVTVWGWAEPGEKITVKGSWSWFGKSTHADKDGKWKVKIKTPKAGKTVSLTVKGNNEIILNDILTGEVWICSGQSNMEMGMTMIDNTAEEIAKADYPGIRLFDVARTTSVSPQQDVTGSWVKCSPETVENHGTWGGFSAAAYYFGRKLHTELNVPIGLISTNWGGTVAEAWTSEDGLQGFEPFKKTLEAIKHPEQQKEIYQQKLHDWENQINQIDSGYQQGWYRADFDDSDWNPMEQPNDWTETDLSDFDGSVWFRRETSLPPSWAKVDMELHLGPVDDIDTLWFNGVKIGTTAGWDIPRVYRIPASVLHVGKNTIAVRVIDMTGAGGFYGKAEDMRIGPVGADVKTCATVAQIWKYKLSRKGADIPSTPVDITGNSPNRPTVLYNAMIAPLIQFRIAGAIWYQGESNCYDPILYRTLFPAMITDWRKQWNEGDFPFYYVQIAPYTYHRGEVSQAIREAQMMTLDSAPNVGMAVTMDIGAEKDIHPKDKLDVGERLARWALTKTYGKKGIVYSGPIYKSMTVEGDKVRISFYYADGGLITQDTGLTNFEIAGEDKVFVPATAVIDGDTVVVSSEEVKEPVAVRYGWSNWVVGSLFNKAGLPASSFRTDDWPLK